MRRNQYSARWDGIDPETSAFCRGLARDGRVPYGAALMWFGSCRDAGLSTCLDADFDDPRLAKHLESQVRLAGGTALVGVLKRHLNFLRIGLKVYTLAADAGLRSRPIPPLAMPLAVRWSISAAETRAKLPVADRRELEQIEAILWRQATRQWQGRGGPAQLGPDGRLHKSTISSGHVRALIADVDSLLRHSYLKGWEPFTLRSLLTPERLTQFIYYAGRCDGAGLSPNTIRNREGSILDYFYRGRNERPDPVVVITVKQEEKIRAAMRAERQHRDKWNVNSPQLRNTGRNKWYPTLDQTSLGVVALEEQIAVAQQRHRLGRLNDLGLWREVRDAVLTLCTLFCMWRVDTAATGSLLHLVRDPMTDAVVDANGFAVMKRIARAKDMKGEWYPFVPELTLPPNVVRLIEMLLALEKRSLAEPLRPGEQPVQLSAAKGDHWGHEPILDGELTVVPIFRKRPDAPDGLTYASIARILEKQLIRLRFGSTNPHTLRATGAIYWLFIQEMPEDLVMTLGLWEDAKTLRACYAHIGQQDRRAQMSRFLPIGMTAEAAQPRQRERAASSALAVLGKMLEKKTNAYEARRFLTTLRRHCEEIDQTIAADLGEAWSPMRPDRFRQGEVERLDGVIRGDGHPGGISEVLGRNLFAEEELRSQSQRRLREPEQPLAQRRLLARIQARPLRMIAPPSRRRPGPDASGGAA